ncbi:FMN-binding protein [Corynebacterium callunae]|uniref:FMN-binding protein n=1 Tax=Corynebacterium callunae TaxID=1721 RepID=UPI001FFE36D2|nr:FMN-binding protein [Corynebacterium callunae]MCK2199861.1 FMN-binding protein [Corynebacterium callunae]
MKKIAWWLMSTLTACVLILGYRTSSATEPALVSETVAVGPAVAGGADPEETTATTAATAAAETTVSSNDGTYTGVSAPTKFGPVQVQITVSDGQITAVEAIDYPTSNGKDQQINSRAIPKLNQEAVAAQSANINTVSGATYTTDGYITSLQSAIDQAGL